MVGTSSMAYGMGTQTSVG